MNETLLSEHRDRIVERLSADYANGAFEVDELERRLALVHTAKTATELEALAPATATTSALVTTDKRLRIWFGAVERKGPWTVPAQLRARVLCGSLELDLRDARLAAGVTTIEVDVTMGSVEVIAPPELEVEVDASSFLGSVEERTERTAAVQGGPVVRIVARVKLGSLEVSTLRRGETRRDARWRHRLERRRRRQMLHRGHCGELPWD